MTRLTYVLSLIGVALLGMTARPTSRFTYHCAGLVCAFTSTSLGAPVKYTWSWGDSRTETHVIGTAGKTYAAPGIYTVRLTVTDSIGGTSYSTQKVSVPAACSCVDTVIVHDTVAPAPPPVAVPPVVIVPPPAPPNGVTLAELPRVYLDTKMPATTGVILSVPVGGDFQAALNKAQPGDAIELANAGTWTGNYILPNKAGASWIVIRPANMTVLPPEGVRVSPRTVGRLPLILSSNNLGAITTDTGAHHWRLVGLEVSITVANTGLIRLGTGYETTLGQLPHDIVLDRVYVHGNSTGNLRRGVILNGINEAVIDSDLRENHEQGTDSQALGGWNGPGPFKITNNYLEGASENIIFGGSDPAIQGLVPSDIEIRHNHITKQLAWHGMGRAVKNLLELKNAQRVLVEGNVLESNWDDAQSGSAVNLKSVNQDGACAWCVTRDVTFRLNLIRNTGSGFSISAHDVSKGALPAPAERLTITDNVFDGINVGVFTGVGHGLMLNGGVIDLTISHCSFLFPSGMAIAFGGPIGDPPVRFTFTNNVVGAGLYGAKGPGLSTLATFLAFPTRFVGNVVIGGDGSVFPLGNFFPKTRADIGADFKLLAGSSYIGTDGKNPGADVDAVVAATAGVVIP